jgi:eukaryotic-like serine/threonine-protein kinase
MSGRDVVDLRSLDLEPLRAVHLPPVLADLPAEVFLKRTPSKQRSAKKTARDIPYRLKREPDLPEIGSLLDKYRLERIIGMGGFGVLYRARHTVLDNVVAIKLMRPSVARERPQLPRLLQEEARYTARIHHENVVRVYDVTTSGDLTYIVMEYVDGPDLSVMIKHRGELPVKMVLKVLRHVGAALSAGLEQSLIHRDVKPSNILLTRGGVTKLTDFGLARSGVGGGLRGVVGTVGYMSPEQLDHPDEIDFRSDIYSLGVTAYQALTGKLPFPDDSPERCANGHRFLTVPPIQRLVPAAVRDLVMSMMAKRPEQRPATYAELDAVLAALVRGPGAR